MLFTDPSRGHPNGYFDGWGDDGCFHYTGEGRYGDQRMIQGNLAVLTHTDQNRTIHLYRSISSGVVALVGEFTLDSQRPWYTTDAPDRDGDIRSVIMFRLRPIDVSPSTAEIPFTPPQQTLVEDVEVEQLHVESMAVNPSSVPRLADRNEAKLVRAYRRYLRSQGHSVGRKRILPSGEIKPLYTDLFDSTQNLLIEAKGTVTREAVRMAIGQLFDYRRYIDPRPDIALLLPSRPRADLIQLCHSDEVAAFAIWPKGEKFESSRTL
ncbi:restriction endonuclease [Streptomyces sp. NBC_00237]|uniref:restriction endonuclease n=1 Tax=Streptomyces sp. NBC_00237 TaxID=2975687 RepID=UPI002255CD22|nr:restriction endonuclease [Streptomyces sp. NBC_00237]MCX5200961.1 restriction endonuclease [Streptomyces sp. NBC_00237]